MMKILVIGASGLVGSHCMRYFKEKEISVIGTHRNFEQINTYYFDPLKENCFDFLNTIHFSPDVIIHCGALTHVDYCEDHENESFNQTVESTIKIVDYCSQNKIKLVYISTDYVFDGINGPYFESAEVNPINVYGRHKLAAEELVKKLENYLIVRITNVFGEEARSKNFISSLVSLIKSNEEKILTLPYDQYATPTYAGDIAKMIYLLLSENKDGLYNLSSTDYYSRYQLAKKIKSYFGVQNRLKLEPISTIELKQKANRPLNGGLVNVKFLNEFPDFEFTNVDKFIIKSLENEL